MTLPQLGPRSIQLSSESSASGPLVAGAHWHAVPVTVSGSIRIWYADAAGPTQIRVVCAAKMGRVLRHAACPYLCGRISPGLPAARRGPVTGRAPGCLLNLLGAGKVFLAFPLFQKRSSLFVVNCKEHVGIVNKFNN